MLSVSKAADLNYLVQGDQLYCAFPLVRVPSSTHLRACINKQECRYSNKTFFRSILNACLQSGTRFLGGYTSFRSKTFDQLTLVLQIVGWQRSGWQAFGWHIWPTDICPTSIWPTSIWPTSIWPTSIWPTNIWTISICTTNNWTISLWLTDSWLRNIWPTDICQQALG